MENSVPGIQPSSLTTEELLKYAHLYNNTGLPKHWVDALIKHLEEKTDRVEELEHDVEVLHQRIDDIL